MGRNHSHPMAPLHWDCCNKVRMPQGVGRDLFTYYSHVVPPIPREKLRHRTGMQRVHVGVIPGRANCFTIRVPYAAKSALSLAH